MRNAEPAPDAVRTGVKDIVDMVLLIDQGLEPSPLLRDSITATFERYERHPLPPALPPPPYEGQETFPPLAREVGLFITNSTQAHAFDAETLTGHPCRAT